MSSNGFPRRSPAFNALVVGAIILAMVIAGTIIWKSWTRGSLTAVDEAHEAVVQPVEPVSPSQGARPATPQPALQQDGSTQ